MPTAEQVLAVLRRAWHRLADECTPLPGGITAANLAAGPVPPEEVEAALPTMLLFRRAVRADHFARRLAGSASDGDRAELEAARVPLTEPAEGLPG